MRREQAPLGAGDEGLRIGELSRRSGVSVRMLRHYDETGLLCPSWHTAGGHREYSTEDVYRLEAIVALRSLGFATADIRTVLDSQPDMAGLIAAQLAAIEQTLATLQQARARLIVMDERLQHGDPVDRDRMLDLAALLTRPSEPLDPDTLRELNRSRADALAGLAPADREQLLARQHELGQRLGPDGITALGPRDPRGPKQGHR